MCAFQRLVRDFLPLHISQIKAGQSIRRSRGRCDLTEAGMKELLKHSTLARHPTQPADLRITSIHYTCNHTLNCTHTYTQFYVLSRTQVCFNVSTLTLIHFLCICMSALCTHMCVIWVGGFGSVWVWIFRDNTLLCNKATHSIYSVFEASNWQQAHCEGVEMHPCVCGCVSVCISA